MDAIVRVDGAWGIGKDNDLICPLPPDMKYFRETTRESVVVLGKRNLESFPQQKPLPKRRNIILSSSLPLSEEYEVFRNLKDLLEMLKTIEKERIFVIGGQQVYEELLPYCHKAYVTKMDQTFEADCYFPNLDCLDSWRLIEESKIEQWEDIRYRFCCYENQRPIQL